MPIRLNDEQCLLWIKDPSVSPFENNYIQHKRRKNILSEANIKNPKSFLNKVKRICFHNSAIRQQIVDKIREYQKDGTLRLYTLNDKLASLSNIEYITPPFTRKECERWLKNHLENPRQETTNEKVYEKISVGDDIYTELIYTALQYGLTPPSTSLIMMVSSALNAKNDTEENKLQNNLQISSCKRMMKLIQVFVSICQ
jgi:hypothetical protein